MAIMTTRLYVNDESSPSAPLKKIKIKFNLLRPFLNKKVKNYI